MVKVQDVELDPESRSMWRDGREIVLSRKEFDLVHALIARAGEIVSRDELMRDVWHTSFWTSSKTIDVHLGWVRRKLGDDPRRPHADHHDPRQGPPLRARPTRPAIPCRRPTCQALAFWRACPSPPPPSPSSVAASWPG